MTPQELIGNRTLLESLHKKALKKDPMGDYAITLFNSLIEVGIDEDEAFDLCLDLIHYYRGLKKMKIEIIIETPNSLDYIMNP